MDKNRKEIIKDFSNHFGIKAKYMGAPSFAYQFESPNGVYTLHQTGKVIDPDGNEVELQSLLTGSSIEGVVASAESVTPADPLVPAEPEAPNDPAPSVESEALAAPVLQVGSAETDAPTDSVPPDASAETKTPAELAVSSASEASAEPGNTALVITVPLDGHTGLTLRNLVNLIYSRQALIGKALGYSGNIIEELFISAIHDRTIDTSEKLMSKIAEVANLCSGIDFDFDCRKLTFKFFQGEQSAEKIQAYTQFVDLLNQTAHTLKYTSSKSKDTDNDNDKFTFRLFLIRLGMVGAEYKTARKVLLDKLEGNSAFRGGSKPEKTVDESVETAEGVS